MEPAHTYETYEDSFRDHIPSADARNKRKWIYPKKPRGKFHNWRIGITTFFLLVFFTLPLIKVNGRPFFLLNFLERKFIIFGGVFWPQDTHLLILLLLSFFVFIILFTAVFGRVWCGWACPQTLFMEMVFRKIEYLVEGDANRQHKLNNGPWDFNRIWRKTLKHFLFILVSLLISHTVMAYITGLDQTISIITHSPAEHPGGFIALLVFTAIFYIVFSVIREIACTVICPYGRLQSVLINKETIIVAYDNVRGEPRGKLRKGETLEKKGDCVDCKLCVHVCPTGIDIRNGTQLECVNCTACIDACDEVMEKIHKPKGLIRYDSLNGIQGQRKLKLNGRIVGYSLILLLLMGVFVALTATREDVEATLVRAPGQLYDKQEDGTIRNLYNIQVINKTYRPKHLEFRLKNSSGRIELLPKGEFDVPEEGKKDGVMAIYLPREEVKGMKTSIRIEVVENGKVVEMIRTSFLGPGGIQ